MSLKYKIHFWTACFTDDNAEVCEKHHIVTTFASSYSDAVQTISKDYPNIVKILVFIMEN